MTEHINLARLKKGSDVFEVVINPDKAIDFRQGKANFDEAVVYPKVFSDAKKGMLASEQRMKALFNTNDHVEVAKLVVKQGEIQLTSEHRQKILDQKRKRIIDIIHRNAIDPRTNTPHPVTRIEAAMQEAKVRIDEFKQPEAQVDEVLKSLRLILPIKFVKKEIDIRIPALSAAKSYSQIKIFGKILKDEWLSDGSWHGIIEIPGGLEEDFYDKLNSLTKGDNQVKVLKTIGE